MRAIIATVVLCLAALVAQGQEVCRGPKIVKTTGTAELKVTPDQATIQLGVERQSATAKYAKAEVASTSRKILAALKELKIEDKDIQTAYLYLEPMIDYRKGLRITNFTRGTVVIHNRSRSFQVRYRDGCGDLRGSQSNRRN